MKIVGISAYFHDSAVALIDAGQIVAAAQEERFTRRKNDAGFPRNALLWCLRHTNTAPEDIAFFAFYDKPFLKFERLLDTYVSFAPQGFTSFRRAIPIWLREKLFLKDLLRREIAEALDGEAVSDRLLFGEHHLSHAASAFYPSPFEEAAVLVLDGVGEWPTASAGIGRNAALQLDRELHFPHSLGLLYSAFTYHLGFEVNEGEYKVMGLAPYGEPAFLDTVLEHLVDLKDDGTFRLNQDYFNYCTGLTMTDDRFTDLFGVPRRQPESDIEKVHRDMAASVQRATEIIMTRLVEDLASRYDTPNLCMAGGVALNCVANGKIQREGPFDNIWVQPAAGDAGGAIGAALAAYHGHAKAERTVQQPDAMHGGLLGPDYSAADIVKSLDQLAADFETLPWEQCLRRATDALANGAVLGFFQGRMEFGPRALGARSIIADPRRPDMQDVLNEKIKLRERFRPFAPAVLADAAAQWFATDRRSPYMLFTDNVRPSDPDEADTPTALPAITHVDGSARIQTVDDKSNPRFHDLLESFAALTGCPVLVNTSFNVRGEPIVCTPEDAYRCYMATGMDALLIGDCWLEKPKA